jgi:hypothetical protein
LIWLTKELEKTLKNYKKRKDNIWLVFTEEDNKPKMTQEERDKLMEEFLSKGGKIKELKPGIAKGAGSLNRSKSLQWTEKDVIEQEHSENFIPSKE